MYNVENPPQVYSFIAGLGGRDITTDVLRRIWSTACEGSMPDNESVWMDLRTDIKP